MAATAEEDTNKLTTNRRARQANKRRHPHSALHFGAFVVASAKQKCSRMFVGCPCVLVCVLQGA